MLTASYGKEPFDLRLTVLRMVRRLPWILGITLAGTLLFGGGYYVKNVLMNREEAYTVTSTYKVGYVDEPTKSGDYYINEMTWNTFVHSEEFLDAVFGHLQEETIRYDSVLVQTSAELADMIEAKLDSDVHVPSTVVTTRSQNWTELLAAAVERTMAEEFVRSNDQVEEIRVIDPAGTAAKVEPDVRPVRALLLSAVLSCFFAVVLFLLKELGDDCIWLPATLNRRYGLPFLGTVNSPEWKNNASYLFCGKQEIAVCAADERIDPMEAAAICRDADADHAEPEHGDSGRGISGRKDAGPDLRKEWIPIPAPLLCPEACERMRRAEGVLLVVRAGAHSGKPLEYVLEYLATQDIKVTAALLWDADEWLIRTYYRLPGDSRQENAEKGISGKRKDKAGE